jgi:hypothetical protein
MSETSNIQLYNLCIKYKVPIIWIGQKDELKGTQRTNGGYIINLESSSEGGGSHWCCFYIEKNQACYMDPFGVIYPLEVKNFLKGLSVCYNTNDIQNINSGYCGEYCILFLKLLSKENNLFLEERMRKIQKLFSEDQTKNLSILKKVLVGLK